MNKLTVYELDHDAIMGLLKTVVHKLDGEVALTMDYLTDVEAEVTAATLVLELDDAQQTGTLRLETPQ